MARAAGRPGRRVPARAPGDRRRRADLRRDRAPLRRMGRADRGRALLPADRLADPVSRGTDLRAEARVSRLGSRPGWEGFARRADRRYAAGTGLPRHYELDRPDRAAAGFGPGRHPVRDAGDGAPELGGLGLSAAPRRYGLVASAVGLPEGGSAGRVGYPDPRYDAAGPVLAVRRSARDG